MTQCSCCLNETGYLRSWWLHTCQLCKTAGLCSNCINYALTAQGKAPRAQACCRKCFRSGVQPFLDLTVSVETYGPAAGEAVTVVLVHGGGASRAMYRPLAQHLASVGYRCVLPDLPAHGGRMDEALTIDTAIASLVAVAQREAPPFRGVKPIYLGGSLGGYIGMELLGRHPSVFGAAVIACAEQTVGAGASLLARSALGVMGFFSRNLLSASTFVGLMISVSNKAKNLDKDLILATCQATGMYFHSADAHVNVLRGTDSVKAMQHFTGPVCYIGGSLDHHDMSDALLATSRSCEVLAAKLTTSIQYKDGDHFFSHDVRFRHQFEDDVSKFICRCVATQTAV